MTNNTETKAYALGIIAREMNIDFDSDLSPDQMAELGQLAEDSILDEPKTELGKKIKETIRIEKENEDSEYNKGFNFHKDLNHNKINPTAIFVFGLLSKYSERLINNDETAEGEMLSELIIKLNELDYPVGYIANPFTMALTQINKLNAALKGQMDYREDQIKALSIGVKHPKYGTLSPHLASFKKLDDSIISLREKYGFTEEDYRSK